MKLSVEQLALKDQIQRIRDITQRDLKNGKMPWECYGSLIEELGEYAQALKIEGDVFGTQHKPELKESAQIELVDLLICTYNMFFIIDGGKTRIDNVVYLIPMRLRKRLMFYGKTDLVRHRPEEFSLEVVAPGKFGELGVLVVAIADATRELATFCLQKQLKKTPVFPEKCDRLIGLCHAIFEQIGGDDVKLTEIMDCKLTKWESSQQDC